MVPELGRLAVRDLREQPGSRLVGLNDHMPARDAQRSRDELDRRTSRVDLLQGRDDSNERVRLLNFVVFTPDQISQQLYARPQLEYGKSCSVKDDQ